MATVSLLLAIPTGLFGIAWDSHALIYSTRFFAGVLQIFPTVYCPVWIDTKGHTRWRALWITF